MNAPEAVRIGGVRFHDLTRAEAAEAVVALARSGQKGYVVKPYSEFIPRAVRDGHVRDALLGAALCLPDGVGILWAAHYLSLPGGRLRALAQLPPSLAAMVMRPSAIRHPLRQPMRGVDFTWDVLEACNRAGLSVYLLGGTKDEAEGAAAAIARRLPTLRIVGVRDGYFRDDAAVIANVNDAAPAVLLVALGFPKQELWIAEHIDALNVNAAIAEGGSFSFISGRTPRAPGIMRSSGLEWLYRLVRQPWRLKRQLALPAFVWLVVSERLRRAD